MKQALEALELEDMACRYEKEPTPEHIAKAITSLRQAIEQADDLEAWKTSDTAYRPEGLPQDFIKHEVDSASDWSEWVCPDPTQYNMKCCDCGLVHEMQFNVVKYSAGDKCEDFDDPYVQAVFRARRVTPPAAATVQEPVAWMVYTQDGQSVYVTDNPTDIQEGQTALPLSTTPPAAEPEQRRPLTDKQILADETLRYYFGQNGGAGPVSKQGRKVVDAIEAAHGIKETKK